MTFSEKLIRLRRREGLSQEQLADRLGVTRQSVSKWESGSAAPETGKLIAISELFGVSLDYLLKSWVEEDAAAAPGGSGTERLERKLDELVRRERGSLCHYTSRARVLGLPLVSVRIGRGRNPNRDNTAVGIVAVGNFAVGVVSVGLITLGVFSLGMLAFGLLALGMVSVGTLAVGVAALGYLALGVSAVGVYAAGVAVCGLRTAVGFSAAAAVAVGRHAAGDHVLLWGDGLSAGEVEAFLSAHNPGLWRPLLRALSFFGGHIQ